MRTMKATNSNSRIYSAANLTVSISTYSISRNDLSKKKRIKEKSNHCISNDGKMMPFHMFVVFCTL